MPLTPNSTSIRRSDADTFEERKTRLADALQSGVHPSTAAAYAGIASTTLARWVDEGKALAGIKEAVDADPDDDREPSVSELELIWIFTTVTEAQAQAELNHVRVIKEASDEGDWRASAWFLERRHKERWSSRSEVTGADGGALKIDDVGERRRAVMDYIAEIGERLRQADELTSTEGHAEVISFERDAPRRGGEGQDEGDGDGVGEGEGSAS